MSAEETQQEIDRINAEIQRLTVEADLIAGEIKNLLHWQEVQTGGDPQ